MLCYCSLSKTTAKIMKNLCQRLKSVWHPHEAALALIHVKTVSIHHPKPKKQMERQTAP